MSVFFHKDAVWLQQAIVHQPASFIKHELARLQDGRHTSASKSLLESVAFFSSCCEELRTARAEFQALIGIRLGGAQTQGQTTPKIFLILRTYTPARRYTLTTHTHTHVYRERDEERIKDRERQASEALTKQLLLQLRDPPSQPLCL